MKLEDNIYIYSLWKSDSSHNFWGISLDPVVADSSILCLSSSRNCDGCGTYSQTLKYPHTNM